jgi:hypothetical protein
MACRRKYVKNVRPWREVRVELAKRTGTEISIARCQQICRVAENKIKRELTGMIAERFGNGR